MTRAPAAAPPPSEQPTATPFGEIMRRVVEAVPGAVGGAFADSEGEMVDSYSTYPKDDWAILTAHYGVVLAQLHSLLGAWHFGGPEYFIAQHAKLDIVVHAVDQGYYELLAVAEHDGVVQLGAALAHLRDAAAQLRREIT